MPATPRDAARDAPAGRRALANVGARGGAHRAPPARRAARPPPHAASGASQVGEHRHGGERPRTSLRQASRRCARRSRARGRSGAGTRPRRPARRRLRRPVRPPRAGARSAPWFSASRRRAQVEPDDRVAGAGRRPRAPRRPRRRTRRSPRPAPATRAPKASASTARSPSAACADGVRRVRPDLQLRAEAPRAAAAGARSTDPRARAESSARRRRARHAQPRARSSTRGSTTPSTSVTAIRWIHGAAGAPAIGLPGPACSAANPAASGSAIPVSARRRRERMADERMRDARRHERALPRGAVVEHEASHVQPGDEPERERGGAGVQPRSRRAASKARALRTAPRARGRRERGAALPPAFGRLRALAQQELHAAHQRAVRALRDGAGAARAPAAAADQQQVDDEVPRQHPPQRRREQVDARRPPMLSATSPDRRRSAPTAAIQRAGQGRRAQPARASGSRGAEALQRVTGALRDEASAAAAAPPASTRDPVGPGAVVVGPVRARRLGLSNACSSVTSRRGARPCRRIARRSPRRLRPAPGRSGSSARRSCLRRSGTRARRGRCARPGSR